jgi:hypothetical protein
MSANWTIAGEVGKAFGADPIPVSAAMMGDPLLDLKSFDVDTLTWQRTAESMPVDYGQSITLYREGQRVFTGIVDRKPVRYTREGGARGSVIVVGPVWWLAETKVLEDVTDGTGATSEQSEMKFPTGDLRAMVQRLLDRATAKGLPIRAGVIDPMFEVLALRYRNQTYLSALLDMLRSVPDAASWVDYSVDGLPTLNIARRPTMPTMTLRVGIDDIESFELVGRRSLRPSGVSVRYATRNALNQVIYQEQTAGSPTQQTVVVASGPALEKWTPPENPDQVQLRTLPLSSTNTDLFYLMSPELVSLKAQYGATLYDIQVGTATGSVPSGGGWISTTMQPVETWTIDGVETAAGTGALAHAIVEGQLPSWWLETGNAVQRVTLTRRMNVGIPNNAPSANHQIAAMLATASHNFGNVTAYFADITITVDAIAIPYTTLTTVIRPAAYEYLTPPANYAANLFAAQNWMPYDGPVVMNPGVPFDRWLGKKLNIENAEPEHATAGALIQGQSIRLLTGTTSLRCGSPERAPAASLMARSIQYGNDNLTTL